MAESVVNIITLGSIYTLFALGLTLSWGTVGVLNMAHGSIFMFSTFIAFWVATNLVYVNPLVDLFIAMAAGASLSVALELLAIQPILRRHKRRSAADTQILVAGIGIATVPVAIADMGTDGSPFGLTGSSSLTYRVSVFGTSVSVIQILIVVVGVSFTVLLAWWLRRSRQGLALRALGVDPEVASLMGVGRRLPSVSVMAVSGALAGLAGALLALQLGVMAPESGDSFLIKAFSAVVLGGVGSVIGTMSAAYVLAACEVLILTATSGVWVDAVSFTLIFLVLLLRPQGLFGKRDVVRT